MGNSTYLAKLIGPLFLAAGAGMLLNRKTLQAMGQEVLRSYTLLYLFGLVDLAAGLAIVLAHNVWTADWRVLITLLGWLMIGRGLFRLLRPDQVRQIGVRMLKRENAVTGSLAAAVLIGLVLTYYGYAA